MDENLKIATTAWLLDSADRGQSLADQAEIAEQLGFHSFWLPESHFSGSASIPAPLMSLAAVASRTSRIRLGSTSYLLPIRHPLQAAEEVAVLDRISNGRVILGIGRGFRNALFTAFEVPAAEKRKRFAAALRTMLAAWSGESIAVEEDPEGRERPVYLGPLPVQRPHPPIWVAAFGPLAIKQAATLGLPYLASPMETETVLVDNYRRHREISVKSGHNPVTTVPVMRTVFVSRKRSLLKTVRESLTQQGRGVLRRGKQVDIEEWALVGEPDYVAERINHYREILNVTHLIARGRIPGASDKEQLVSMQLLGEMT
jgi:alkanesulfonate monooxygenase SsuD/methylene tetrahydromethanopterin reductase-like flavin-dependent oxidoreductase (luciferase family)|tara:strand:- start:36 stop:980 length:945 start_codon:yes stop_codon:yes gene_type:complete